MTKLSKENPMKELTQEELKQVLHYDPETGVFTWLVAVGGVMVGDVAGTTHVQGYVQVRVGGFYLAHRLAFLYMTGNFPSIDIDHINGNRSDNRWGNLRPCTHQQNMFNMKTRVDSISGFKGVTRKRNGWQARIMINGKPKFLGVFDTPEQAAKVYEGHAKKLHGEFAYLGGE